MTNWYYKKEKEVLSIYPDATEDYVEALVLTMRDKQLSVEEAAIDYNQYYRSIK